MNPWCKNLELLIKSRTSLIWIRTKEEERLEKLVNVTCERLNIKRFVSWDCVSGIKGLINENSIYETLMSVKRAGANAIISYFADRIEKLLKIKVFKFLIFFALTKVFFSRLNFFTLFSPPDFFNID